MDPAPRQAAAPPDGASALADDFARAARVIFSAGTVTGTLTTVSALAVATVEGCDFACIVFPENTLTSPVHTSPLAAGLHAIQRESGEGPCLDAITHGSSFYSGDLGNDTRWPRFGAAAAAAGTRSLLAMPVPVSSTRGALCLCAGSPAAFGVADRARGLLLAALAGLAFISARDHEGGERRAANLRLALATREVIGQAQGILMERERVTADQAFGILRRASQHLNIKLRDVAQTLVDTGQTPETGPPGPWPGTGPSPVG